MTNPETAALARIRQMADAWEQQLPEVIRTPAVVSALRAVLDAAAPAVVEPPTSTAPLAAGLPLVQGNCPACRGASLFLGDGGYVTCSRIDCPEPDAASTLLEQPAGPAVVEPPADRAAEPVREQLLRAIDFNYVASLGYTTPEELLAAYDTSRTPPDQTAPVCRDAEGCHRVVPCDPGCGARDLLAEATRPRPEPADQTALRDRIAEAVEECRTLTPAALADAVLAVLPEPTDRAEWDALCRETDRLRKAWGEMRDRAERIEAEVERLTADRAAVLREAADAVAAHPGPIPWLPGLPKGEGEGFWWDTRDRDAAADLLRRMADETATETPHTCKSGASTYHCPTSGQTESDCHGGFTTCCDRPDLHQPAAGARQDGTET